MASADWLEELRHILDADLQLRAYKPGQWQELETLADEDPELFRQLPGGAVAVQGTADAQRADVLEIRRARPLGHTELRLIGWMLGAMKAGKAAPAAPTGVEKQAASLGAWIMEQLERPQAEMLPEALTMGGRLYADMIPFLLIREYHGLVDEPYAELEKLLRSFFEEEIILLPLQRNEWLILSPTAPLSDSLLDSGKRRNRKRRACARSDLACMTCWQASGSANAISQSLFRSSRPSRSSRRPPCCGKRCSSDAASRSGRACTCPGSSTSSGCSARSPKETARGSWSRRSAAPTTMWSRKS